MGAPSSAPPPSGNVTIQTSVYGPQNPSLPSGQNGYVLVPTDVCYCEGWYDNKGTSGQEMFSTIMQWVCFITCLLILLMNLFIFFKRGRNAVSWEVCWVMGIVFTFYGFEIFREFSSPVMIYLSTGNFVVMLRYGQWLFATPVLLVAVADLASVKPHYSKTDMYMVVADVAAVTIFIFSCLSTNFWVKGICYILSFFGFCYLFWIAWKCLRALSESVPTKGMKKMVTCITVVFFLGWNMHTVFSSIGPDCFGWLNSLATEIGACFSDMVAKCTFCLLVTIFRLQMDSYQRKKAKEQGVDIEGPNANEAVAALVAKEAEMAAKDEAGLKKLLPGRVILAVPDASMVDFFTSLFQGMSAPVELIPSVGVEGTLTLVQMSMQQGGLDMVLVDPDFLTDRSSNNLALRIKMMGQRVVTYGWSPKPASLQELRDGTAPGFMLDAWLSDAEMEDSTRMEEVLSMMQQLQKLSCGSGEAPSGMMSPAMPASFMIGTNNKNMGMNAHGQARSMAMMGAPQPQLGRGMHSAPAHNPLYAAPRAFPSLAQQQLMMQQQQLQMATAISHPVPSPAPATTPESEALMLERLMNEINQLKSEMGES